MVKITSFKQQEEDYIDESLDRANQLSSFYNEFSLETPSASSTPAPSQTNPPSSLDPQLNWYISAVSSSTSVMELAAAPPLSSTTSGDSAPYSSVLSSWELKSLNWSKTAGPDGGSLRVLKACADQLCGSLQHLFNLSLSQEKVPVLWKTSYTCSNAKKIYLLPTTMDLLC